MKVIGIPLNPPAHGQYTGVERYVFELVRAMMQLPLPDGVRIELYSARPLDMLGTLPERWSNLVLPWKFKGWTHIRLSAHLMRYAPDILFIPAHEIPFFTGRANIITTVHDIAFAIVPEVYASKEVKRQHWALRNVIKRADHVLAVSQSTKDDLVRALHVDPNGITVTPLASTSTLAVPDLEFVAQTLRAHKLTSKQYVLYVGRLEQKKGILEFLHVFDAYKQAQGFGDPLELVLVGKFGYGGAEIQQTLAQLNRKDIRVLGFVEDSQLAALFAGARAFVFPTRYEGFGIPLLEAMSFDLPILTTDLPVTREVAGAAALYAQYGNVQAWVRNLQQVMRDEEVVEMLVEAGRHQRGKFGWEKTARTTLDALLK